MKSRKPVSDSESPMDVTQNLTPSIEELADAEQSSDGSQGDNEIISDPQLFEAIGACCTDRSHLMMSPKIKDLIARYAPADRPYANFIPQERRRAFLGELSQVTGRMLPSDQAKLWEEFYYSLGMAPPSKTDATPSASAAAEPVNPAENNVPARRPKIVGDLIRVHNILIHKLAASFAGKGKIIVAGFGENPAKINSKTGKPGHPFLPVYPMFMQGTKKVQRKESPNFLGNPTTTFTCRWRSSAQTCRPVRRGLRKT
jgi:hypothetical protein